MRATHVRSDMKPALVLLPLFALLACARGDAAAAPNPGRPVLVELFTSQGCSSCPPADKAVAALAARPLDQRTMIPLAFHVDYWDRLGWRDPFSSADWSARQNRYAAAFRSDTVFTPQLVVAGAGGCSGNDGGAVQRLVDKAAAEPVQASVTVEPAERTAKVWPVTVRAQRERVAGAPAAEVFVALYENGLETEVRGGENNHKTLRDERVVRRLVRALTLPAGGGSADARVEVPIEPGWGKALGLVAFVQEPKTMHVLAVAEAAAPSAP